MKTSCLDWTWARCSMILHHRCPWLRFVKMSHLTAMGRRTPPIITPRKRSITHRLKVALGIPHKDHEPITTAK
jgi:hypothetical protein